MPIRLLYLVDRPIQYQAPLLRLIAGLGDIDLMVVHKDAGGRFDAGFGRTVTWDVPLIDGYAHEIVPGDGRLAGFIEDCDVVWLHGWRGARAWRALAVARRRGVPVLMRGENTLAAMPDGRALRGVLKRRYLKWIFERCRAFLTVGGANRDYYRAHGVGPERLFPMPYAVDNDFFRSRAAAAAGGRARFRSALGLDGEGPVILFAGKLLARKNPLVLVEAFRGLDHAGLGHPYLLFVGDGALRPALEKAAAGDDRVRVLGFRNQTEMPAFYDLADVFVLASHREPWGLAVNEAMNGRCAVVVSDECGCAGDLVDETRGAVVAPGDARALGQALTQILSDRDRCREMGEAAQARIRGWNFDADVEGLRQALAAVCQGPVCQGPVGQGPRQA